MAKRDSIPELTRLHWLTDFESNLLCNYRLLKSNEMRSMIVDLIARLVTKDGTLDDNVVSIRR